MTLQNVGSSAWVVTAVEGAENVAELNAENTPITLTTGQRYRFVNLGTLQIHPLALRGNDGESLLNQRPQDRPFETDPAVAFSADDEGVSFTLTETLAAQLATYYCTAHPAPLMEGPLEEAASRYEAVSLPVSGANPAKGLYERSGFVQVGEDGASTVMLRRLRVR